MPNGPNENDNVLNRPYNFFWCNERHKKLDEKMEKMEYWFLRIILLLVGNLCAATATLFMLYIQG